MKDPKNLRWPIKALWLSFTIRKNLYWPTSWQVHTKSWILLLKSKNEFFNIFRLWFSCIEETSKEKVGCLQIDGEGKFISILLQDFCKERSLIISYVVPYINEENGIAKQCWKTLAIIKNIILINSGLLINFWAEAIDMANYFHTHLPINWDNPTIIPEEILWQTQGKA